MPDDNIKILIKETLLKTIENSIGSKLFNSLIVKFQDSGLVKDILNNGEYSCAYYVSSILYGLSLIDKPHATVKTVLEKLKENNWQEVHDDVKPGDIIVWEKNKTADGTEHEHLGFVLNKNEAVSNYSTKRKIAKHSIDFNGKRKIAVVYRINL